MRNESQHLVKQVHLLLAARHQSLAVAESLTGGLVMQLLTEPAGASLVINGGVVAYTPDSKIKTLDLAPSLIESQGVVSAQVALAMATNVCELFGATWGLATTGVAGPAPSGDSPLGRVFVAVVGPSVTDTAELDLRGDRDEIRALSAEAVLALLVKNLT